MTENVGLLALFKYGLGGIINRIKTISKNQWFVGINVLLIILMGLLHALEAGHYVNFYPINGTFQDFNPIRRLLNGQIPYRDFQDYLGLGHVYIGGILTWILGGNYRASLIAFRYAAYLSMSLIFFVVGKLVFKKTSTALCLVNFLDAVLLIQPTFLSTLNIDATISSALSYAMTTGNSARMLRGEILPISIFMVITFGKKVLDFAKDRKRISPMNTVGIFVGILSGFCFPWSNDYGISSWLCMIIVTGIIIYIIKRKIIDTLKVIMIVVLTSVLSCFIFVNLFTLGHFAGWFSSTFGTGGYQSWYYISDKSYYITDVDFSYLMLIQAAFVLFFIIRAWKSCEDSFEVVRYGLLAYINMTSFCAVNEYKLLSGNDSREVAMVVLFVTIISEITNILREIVPNNKITNTFKGVITITCFAWVISKAQTELDFFVFTEKEGVYIEALGGYMTPLSADKQSLGVDILATADFLGDAKTFATYSSAQEVVSNNFQPSGTDYLIHVLGDSQREEYLDSFENDDFDYAVTINESFESWEFWLQHANWFFYESLLENWHPIYANQYEIYWERNSGVDSNNIYNGEIQVRIEPTDSRAYKVVVETDPSINGMADVYIDYEAHKDNGLTSHLIINSMVNVANTGVSFSNSSIADSTTLRPKSQEYIPINVVDGYGEVTITPEPVKSMILDINKVSCDKIYTVQDSYLQIDGIVEDEEHYYLHYVDGHRAAKVAESIEKIYLEDIPCDVLGVEDGYIQIKKLNMAVDIRTLAEKNMFRVE